ncbi:hypothetical protein A8H35_08945 [Burkholderia thailandensis]|nr:hypothetical protein A8H35_08945 [Burkholderia thailandensis]NOK42705.1 hypothetical protein [Burkholderia thailandensis]NOK52034.1 hypothetical protein [Burkholderia thailandensis]PHH36982.1 hypothetical protein CRX59_10125 [Burkholderia thailandensis]
MPRWRVLPAARKEKRRWRGGTSEPASRPPARHDETIIARRARGRQSVDRPTAPRIAHHAPGARPPRGVRGLNSLTVRTP